MRTMCFKRLPYLVSGADLWIVVHSRENPSTEDWSSYISALTESAAQRGLELLPTLVLSDGGGPNTIQRAAINDLQERMRTTARVAFVSDSPLLRGVTRTMTWFNPKFRSFSPQDFSEAVAHLGVPAAKVDLIRNAILEMELEIGGPKLDTVRTLFGRKTMPSRSH